MKRNFKDLPIPAYFQMENKVYQKISKTKIREFGGESDTIMRKNPEVIYFGQDINDVICNSKIV